jgi:Kdo2-lipid IVA lauroyltransferase/acyltransferase
VLYALTWLRRRLPMALAAPLADAGARIGCAATRATSASRGATWSSTGPAATRAGQLHRAAEAILAAPGPRCWKRCGCGAVPAERPAPGPRVHGTAHYRRSRRRRGVMIAAPHYGNWELLALYLASLDAAGGAVPPPDSRPATFMHRVRSAAGTSRPSPRRARNGVRQLVKRLRGRWRGRHPARPAAQGRRGRVRAVLRPAGADDDAVLEAGGAHRRGDGAGVHRSTRRRPGRYAVHIEPMPGRGGRDAVTGVAALNRDRGQSPRATRRSTSGPTSASRSAHPAAGRQSVLARLLLIAARPPARARLDPRRTADQGVLHARRATAPTAGAWTRHRNASRRLGTRRCPPGKAAAYAFAHAGFGHHARHGRGADAGLATTAADG